MVNLRQRTAAATKVTKTIPAKRTSGRNSGKSPSKEGKYAEVEEDIEIDEESDVLSSSSSDIEVSDDTEDSVVIEDDEDGSEDDKEIRRIIEKTEAETKNIPLTARQRAKLEGKGDEDDEVLVEAQNEAKALTDEQALRKSEKSRRRKLQRDQKMEETKRATIDRLLLKQKKTVPSAASGEAEGSTSEQILNQSAEISADPFARTLQSGSIRLIETAQKTILQFADDSTFEAAFTDFSVKPSRRDCVCQVCAKNPSKYAHPSKGTLFCSSSCYKMIK